jgi:hypothetical protein
MTNRRRVEHSTSCHHWCQPRLALLLVTRRAFRADTRRGFAPAPRYICAQCGLEAPRPDILCVPRLIGRGGHPGHLALAPGSDQGTISEGRGYPSTPEIR